MTTEERFAFADRISDRVIDMVNEEIKNPGFDPIQMMTGIILGLKGYLTTCPREGRPLALVGLELACDTVLEEIIEAHK